MLHCGNDETGQNALCGSYLNNRRTGKDAMEPRTLGLLGQSGFSCYNNDRSYIHTLQPPPV